MVGRLLFLLLLSLPAFAEWQSTDDSTLGFEASFEGEPLPGSLPVFTVLYAPAESKLLVSVDVTKADFGDEEMNAILFDPAWFGTDHDTATFVATSVREDGDGRWLASGDFTLKGVTQTIDVPFSWEQDGDRGRMRGEVRLDRTLFDVGSGEWSTAESFALEVIVRFDVKLQR